MTSCYLHASTLVGAITAPPAKSHTLRAILFASMAQGDSVIQHYLHSPDTSAMIMACQQLGAVITVYPDRLEITGTAGKLRLPDDVIDAGNSGQVLRFIGALAALLDGYVVLTGDHSIRYNRPVLPLMRGLTQLGAQCISLKNNDHAPLIIKGPLSAGCVQIDGADSQPVSGLLMVSAFLPGTTEIRVNNPGETPWVALTLSWLDKLGVRYSNDNFTHYTVHGGKAIDGFRYAVPGDFSAMAYPIVAALITQSTLVIHNVTMSDPQGDKAVLAILRSMGAQITYHDQQLQVYPSGTLSGRNIDVNAVIDALPILAVLGCYASGTTTLTNAAIARYKESDRLAAITQELTKMGAQIQATDTSLTVTGGALHGAELHSHRDHRIALSLIVAACGSSTPCRLQDIECISKSYPDFIPAMQTLGARIELSS